MVGRKFIFLSLILSLCLASFVFAATAVQETEEGEKIIVIRNPPTIAPEDVAPEETGNNISAEIENDTSVKKPLPTTAIISIVSGIILIAIIIILIIVFTKKRKTIQQININNNTK